MRTVQTVGILLVLAAAGCASGKSAPSELTDASDTDTNPDPMVDARPDATPIDAPPDACVPVATEKLANPVFDLTPDGVGWTAVRNPQLFPIVSPNPTGVVPQSAPNKAWFGGAAGNDVGQSSVTDSLHQDLTIPASATTFTITGYYLIGGIEVTGTTYDTFSLDVINPTTAAVIENIITLNNKQNTGASTFTLFSKTLTANLAGQTVRLRGTSSNDIVNHTSFWLDSLSFKATHCPGAQ